MPSEQSIPLSEYYRLPQAALSAECYKRQLEVVCSNATSAFFIMDEYQRCVYMNPAAEALTGYSLAEIQGRVLHDVIHHSRPDGRPYPVCECPIDRVPQNNREQGEEVFVHQDGHFYPVAYTASPIREGGKTVGTVIEVRDITQEKLDQQARQDASMALASINDGFYTLDRSWRLTYVNDRYCQMVGLSRLELLGQNLWELFPDAVDTEAHVQFHQAMADQTPRQFDYLYTPWNCWHDHRIYPSLTGLTVLLADITERKRTEAALLESEARFRTMADNAPIMIWVTDPTGFCIYLSRSWYDFTGGTEATDLGFGWLNATHPDDRASAEAIFLAANARQAAFTIEYRLCRHDGQYRTCIDAAKPWFGSDGAFQGFIGSVVDIDDRIQAEAALRESEQRLQLMSDAIPQTVWITDIEGRVEFFNRQDCAGVSDANLVHPDDSDRTMAAFNEARRVGGLFSIEHRILSAAGTYRWFLVRAEPCQDPQTGEIRRWFGASVDIHDRKQAEAELQASETRYRLLAEVIPQLVWMTDAAGQNEYVNQRFCDYTGLSVEQMRGLNWLSIIHPDDLEMTRARWLAAVNSDKFYEIEYRFLRHDGIYRWFLGQGIPLKDEQGRIRQWFGTCTDIEPQKQIEQARLRLFEQEQTAREQAENANRIKDEFLAVLSHELRSPLNPILGWSKLLQQGNLSAAKTQTALATIERNAQLQAQLIDDLLDISRILSGKLSLNVAPVDLSRVIAAALDTVHLAAEAKSLHIQTHIPPEMGAVVGDAGRLQQVIWNLLSNAVKFTPQGGQITVALTQLASYAQIQVADTGKGIHPDFLPYVFEHFRQEDGATTRKFGGLGLGLAIARQIVELHGGQIRVDSFGEGQGATFTVLLPLALLDQWPATDLPVVAAGNLQGISILVVDDDSDSREFVVFVLEQAGARVTSFASGIEALQTIEQAMPDLLVSDIGMPEMDGYMLMQQVRGLEQGQQVPAIALTAYASEFDRQQALKAGFQFHLAKPVDPAELVTRVAHLHQRLVSGNVIA